MLVAAGSEFPKRQWPPLAEMTPSGVVTLTVNQADELLSEPDLDCDGLAGSGTPLILAPASAAPATAPSAAPVAALTNTAFKACFALATIPSGAFLRVVPRAAFLVAAVFGAPCFAFFLASLAGGALLAVARALVAEELLVAADFFLAADFLALAVPVFPDLRAVFLTGIRFAVSPMVVDPHEATLPHF